MYNATIKSYLYIIHAQKQQCNNYQLNENLLSLKLHIFFFIETCFTRFPLKRFAGFAVFLKSTFQKRFFFIIIQQKNHLCSESNRQRSRIARMEILVLQKYSLTLQKKKKRTFSLQYLYSFPCLNIDQVKNFKLVLPFYQDKKKKKSLRKNK